MYFVVIFDLPERRMPVMTFISGVPIKLINLLKYVSLSISFIVSPPTSIIPFHFPKSIILLFREIESQK